MMKHSTVTLKKLSIINNITMLISLIFVTTITLVSYINSTEHRLFYTAIAFISTLIFSMIISLAVNKFIIEKYNKLLIMEAHDFAETLFHGRITDKESVEGLIRQLDKYKSEKQR